MALNRLAISGVAIIMAGSVALRAEAASLQTVRDVYQCAIQQHEMLAAYHLYASDTKDRVLHADFMKADQAAADCAARASESMTAAGLAAQSSEIQAIREKLAHAIAYNANSLAKTGVHENEVLVEMVGHELKLVSTLSQSAKDLQVAAKLKDVPEARQARELGIMIMYADARYIERTTEAYHRDDSNEPTIDQLGARFSSGLSSLRASKKVTAQQRKVLDNVNTRFRFINGSLTNYTQNAVPFTVNRHAVSMMTLLNQVANGLEGEK